MASRTCQGSSGLLLHVLRQCATVPCASLQQDGKWTSRAATRFISGTSNSSPSPSPSTFGLFNDSAAPNGPPAFVFDIDGVLVRGKNVLQATSKAVRQLTDGSGRWRYPVMFMTNGGGVPEAEKAAQLSGWLGAHVAEEQVLLSHTPMRQLVARLGHQPVLVLGRHKSAEVAAGYGFSHVITPADLATVLGPTALPFIKHAPQSSSATTASTSAIDADTSTGPPTDLATTSPSHTSHPPHARDPHTAQHSGQAPSTSGQGSGGGRGLGGGGGGGEELMTQPVKAVMVFADPAGQDWYRDLQLTVDVITSGGRPHTQHTPPADAPPVELYFSNPDLLWANDHPRSRFGQGAFAEALTCLLQRVAGRPHPAVKFYGKPNPEPYRLAEQRLVAQAASLGLIEGACAGRPAQQVFSSIYAVGDNPAADVRGANRAGRPWVSVLVKTGVFQGPGPNCPVDGAVLVVEDVSAAVEAGLHHSRALRWHAMR